MLDTRINEERWITRDTCERDHANPQAEGTDNSYRNIVADCHECNKLKQDMISVNSSQKSCEIFT